MLMQTCGEDYHTFEILRNIVLRIFPSVAYINVYYHEVLEVGSVSTERKRKITLLNLNMNVTLIWTFIMRYLEHITNINSGAFSLMFWYMKAYRIHRVNKMPLTPELNPSAQRCLTRFFTGDFASWTIHFVNRCVKNQQIHQLFIQFINYEW
jgi:hypothetical protein